MIYTSYFNQPRIRKLSHTDKISISNSQPNYLVDRYSTFSELAPNYTMITKYKNSEITWEQFTEYYRKEVLDKLNPKKVYEELDGYIILCHCKGNCHRHLVAEWFREYHLQVEEF